MEISFKLALFFSFLSFLLNLLFIDHFLHSFIMEISFKLALFFSFLSLSFCHELHQNINPHHHPFPRPLIIETHLDTASRLHDDHDRGLEISNHYLNCTSWRFAAETNNLNPWRVVPSECAEYVKNYMTGKAYGIDIDRVSREAGIYAKGVDLLGDGKDVWIFDIDETLLSNLPYYAEHRYGLEVFDGVEFDKWVEKGKAPAIVASLKLYEEVLSLGFKVFLMTGRSEKLRSVTTENLISSGFRSWDKLILRSAADITKSATSYKSEKRTEIVEDGYRIIGNSGDQWSDLLGSATSARSFKLPNPMYYIP